MEPDLLDAKPSKLSLPDMARVQALQREGICAPEQAKWSSTPVF